MVNRKQLNRKGLSGVDSLDKVTVFGRSPLHPPEADALIASLLSRIRRIERSEMLGSKSDLPTKRLALRELEKRLSVVNDPRYRARPTATFAEFAVRWESLMLSQYKQSTRVTVKSHLCKHHVPSFGHLQMKDIYPENVQRFVSSADASPKTKKNLFATMQMLWKTARAWGYVPHDAVSDVVLPKRQRSAQRFSSVGEIRRILDAAPEPYLAFYWIAAEAGMRAGELVRVSHRHRPKS